MTRVLGTNEWFDAFYEKDSSSSFFRAAQTVMRRKATVDDIEKYVGQRLATIFPYVAKPKRIRAGGKSLFSLFFAVSNPNKRAIELASKVASHLLK